MPKQPACLAFALACAALMPRPGAAALALTQGDALFDDPALGEMGPPLLPPTPQTPEYGPPVPPSLPVARQDGAVVNSVAPPAPEARPPTAPDGSGQVQDQVMSDVPAAAKAPTWTGRIEAGIAGATGTSETLNLRFGASADRKAPDMETQLKLTYRYDTNEGESSEHRAESQARNDWNFRPSRWGAFAIARAEYDEFERYKYRASLFGGPTYRLIEDDRTTLKLRAGAGFTREFGKQARNEFIPELNFGLDLEHAFTERQKITLTLDYFPSLADFSEFRTDSRLAYEFLVDPELNLTLKLGVNHRYNSEPGPDYDRSDFEYFATLGWTF